MSQFRTICHSENTYYVQKKFLFWWFTVKEAINHDTTAVKFFTSAADARAYIQEEYSNIKFTEYVVDTFET